MCLPFPEPSHRSILILMILPYYKSINQNEPFISFLPFSTSMLPVFFFLFFIFACYSFLQEVDHPNIIKLREVFFGSRTVYLVMELCKGGELFDEITHNAQRGLSEVRSSKCIDLSTNQDTFIPMHIHAQIGRASCRERV